MLAIAISSVPGYARIVRASVLTVKDQEFVEAAKCIGANNFEIISSHILPNCMAPIIVQVSLKAVSYTHLDGIYVCGECPDIFCRHG